MYRKQLLVFLLLTTLCVMLLLRSALAAVTISSFTAEASDSSILVKWDTATEQDTIRFELYRSTTQSPPAWDDEICRVNATGNAQTGASYHCEDTKAIVKGVTYYYHLKEIRSDNTVADLDESASAVVPLQTDTPGPTATPTRTFTPQPTAITRYTVPTPTTPAPTATRKYTDAPPTAPPVTPSPTRPPTATPFPVPTATPLPPARVASPTGRAPLVTLPAATMPTLTPELVKPVTPLPTETPTPELAAIAEGPEETATPLPTKDVTPIIFSAEARGNGSPTPQDAGQVAGQNSSSLALIVGGSAVGLAALLAAVLLFLRSRRA